MRRETINWITQADADFDSACKSFDSKIYYLCAFLCHQAALKYLKGFIIETKKKLPQKTHDLVSLGKEAEVEAKILTRLRTLNPHFKISRYPDAANGIPCHNYDEINTKPLLDSTREIIGCIKNQLHK